MENVFPRRKICISLSLTSFIQTNGLSLVVVWALTECIIEPLMTNPIKWLHPAKTRISLGIRPVWSESFLWIAKDPSFLHAAKTRIRLGKCQGWSESLLGAQLVLLVLSWDGSIMSFYRFWCAAASFVKDKQMKSHCKIPFAKMPSLKFGYYWI